MVGVPNRDRRAERRESTRHEILAAAWEVAGQNGIAGLTLREVALRIGMQPPSLYSLGMVEMAASIREGMRQNKAATMDGEFDIDALTALQVHERADWTGARIAARLADRWPAAAKGRRRTPWFIRRRPVPPFEVNGVRETWTTGYLIDTILTRDPWTHRMDISRALGRAPVLTPDHDGVIVADVVAEWAQRHGKDFTLTLTGAAGGTRTVGENGPVIELDAVEFCRVLSKRPGDVTLEALLSTEVPF